MQVQDFEIARRGLATSFAESETPTQYALKFRNRLINAAGGAEKRRGMVQSGNAVPGLPNLTNWHQWVNDTDGATRYVSGDGKIFKFDGTNYTQVYAGFTTTGKIRSYQFDKKLVFYNGTDRAVYTEDDGATFKELVALIEEGTVSTSASANALTDADLAGAWDTTSVTENDIVFNLTRNAYAVVTGVTSARVTHTAISAAAVGLGAASSGEQTTGDLYRVLDMIELNVVQTETVPDNVGTLITGSHSARVVLSADRVANWTATEIRTGDIVYNTTRAALSKVASITASSITLSPGIATQVAGDSVVFLKSAMPVPYFAHVHYGRVYNIDARNRKRILISGPNDPQDYTVDSVTQDTVTLNIGGQQPTAEPAVAIASFQTFLVVGTHKNVIAYRGTDPADLAPAGLFPQGLVSPDAFVNTGNDLAFVAPDGLLSVSLLVNSNNLQRSNLSEPIRTTLRELINLTPENQIQCYNYQRRSWLIVKIGSRWFVYNYANFVLEDGRLAAGASWSEFDGLLCQQNAYGVDFDYNLIAVGANGRVYEVDTSAVYTDAGQRYSTEYQTSWMAPFEGRKSARMKSGAYIAPIFEVGAPVNYTVEAVGNYDVESIDTTVVSAESLGGAIGTATIGSGVLGGGRSTGTKAPLRWRGDNVRITFRTNDPGGPDVISSFTLYGNVHGVR